MLTYDQFSQTLEGFPWLNDCHGYPKAISGKCKIRKQLINAGYDTIIDLQNSIQTRRLTRSIKPKHVFRFHRSRWNRWQRIHLPLKRDNLKTPAPVALGYLDACLDLRLRDDSKGIEMQVTENWENSAQKLLTEFFKLHLPKADDTLLLFAPGARHNTKMMPTEKWIELLEISQKNGYRNQVLLGSQVDKALCDQIENEVQHKVLNLAGKTEIGELTAVIKHGDVLITGDSAPMHIAAAVGTPLVAIFGATVPEFGFGPMRCQHRIVQVSDLSCRPCHPHGQGKCPLDHFRCMRDISADTVFSTVKELLASKSESLALKAG